MFKGFAASNIAWPRDGLERALELLPKLGLAGVEIAPRNVFGSWAIADEEVCELRKRIEHRGLICPSLQGILFDVPIAALFGSDESRFALARHLERVAHIASLLGASTCVFGAPRQRDPGTLSTELAREIAIEFFRGVGRCFASRGTTLALEANASHYNCRFVTTTQEAIDLVRAVSTPGISLQIDTGTIFLEGEDPIVLNDAAPLAAHAHVSEPDLQPLGRTGVNHTAVARALKQSGYGGYVSIEMRAVSDWETALAGAVQLLRRHYA